MSPNRLLAILLVALAAIAVRLPAGPPDEGRLLSHVFLPEDYHGDTEVSDVAQTPDGLIYAANLGALKEYDGCSWSTIPVPTGWIRQLAVGEDGSVYFAAFDEIGPVERGADGRRRFRSLLAQVPDALKPLGRIRACVARDGAVFWNTTRHVLRWHGGQMKTWSFAEDADLMLLDGATRIYLVDAGRALLRLEGDVWETVSTDARVTRPLPALFDRWSENERVAIDPDGRVWHIAVGGSVEEVATALTADDVTGGVVHGIVLRDGRLALSTSGGGLLIVATDGRIDGRFGLDGGVGLPMLHRLLQDREGGLWMGSGLGVVRVDLDRGVTVFDDKAGIPPGVGLSVFVHEGVLHSCGEDGLYRFEPGENGRRGRFVRVEGPTFYPYGTASHASGRLVISDKGLFRFADGAFVHEFTTPEQVYVIHVSQAEPDRLFLGGTGFLRMACWDGTGWHDAGAVESMHEDVVSIAEDREGSLWIGTPTNGPVRVHRRPGQTDWPTALTTRYGPDRGLPEGHEWVSTYPGPTRPLMSHSVGVSIYDSIGDRIVPHPGFIAVGRGERYVFPLTTTPSEAIWAQIGNPARDEPMELGGIVPDGSGWRWIALSPRILDAMGFPGAYQISWQPGAYEDGILWIVTRGKIFRVDLAAERNLPAEAPPPVVIRGVRLGEADLAVDDPEPGTGTRPATLGRSRQPLQIRVASPVFGVGGTVEFQHRLLGFRDAWSAWSPSTEIEYTNLPPGSYTCEVRARIAGGAPGSETRWRCTIAPDWWEGWPARILGGVGIAAVFVLALRLRTRSLQRDRERLERIVGQRTAELAEARDRADAANRAKTHFLASMSHELRTPLHAILGYSQLLGADTALPPAARERLGIVGSSGRHLLRLINEVLDLSKIEAGKLELQVASFDLSALLASVAAAQQPRAAAKGLEFRRSDPAGLPVTVAGDAAKLRQVLENLLGNAIKFTARGEVRLLALPLSGSRVHFEVSDTGPGIPPADLGRLFQPFTQLGVTEGGTGLGLAIAQRLVVLMGSAIEVASTVGQGSRFWFELDFAVVSATEPSAHASRRIVGYEGPRRRVLAVDDVEANRRLFVDLLAPLGFEMAEAGTAAEALTRLESFRPDVVLLDLRLPDLDGLSLTRRMRADPHLEGVKILAASASVFGHDPAEALAAGCDGFIAKPFLPEELFARLAALLGLTWLEVATQDIGGDRPLDPELLAHLHAAAEAGDVLAMREVFARLQAGCAGGQALEALGRAIAAFDTTSVVRLTSPAHSAST